MSSANYREQFEHFLESVDLDAYRGKYRSIKIVEMNLPKNIQALALIYEIYWKEKRFIDFETFYEEYSKKYGEAIEQFRVETTMCPDCFKRGLRARIYRTWASLITQIQGGYVAEDVFGRGSVEMSEELDHLGADIRVTYKDRKLNYQVKKESYSGVIGRPKEVSKKLDGENIEIDYCVVDKTLIDNPKRRDGKYYSAYEWFLEKEKTLGLKILRNGFVIFTPFQFELKKREIDAAT